MASLLNALIGEYRVTELLGAGGMGEVYKATHTHLGRVIAIKVLSAGGSDPATVQRFYGEANIQASLRHPGVAEYLGFYEYQGRPCILMELVDGQTLSSLLERRGALPAKEALGIARAITAVVAHFHQQGVLHRDIKSSNVKIAYDGTVKVLDFGIARFQKTNNLTRTGMVVGTPGILAPEQVRGQTVTPATDVWQLGVLMYEMLTVRMPFEADNTPELYAQILNAKFEPVSSLQPSVPTAFEKIVNRCLHKDPNRRFASGADLLVALDGLNALEPEERAPAKERQLVDFRFPVPLRLVGAIAAGALMIAVVVVGAVRWLGENPPLPEPCVQSSSSPGSSGIRAVRIKTTDGEEAQVLCNGRVVGSTADYSVHARTGDRVVLALQRTGYKREDLNFTVTEGQKDYKAPDMDPDPVGEH
jgi:serine/threonine protein kinase